MSDKEWVLNELKNYKLKQITYEERAFLDEVENVILEQYKRIEQAKGELDGQLWSPKKW